MLLSRFSASAWTLSMNATSTVLSNRLSESGQIAKAEPQ